MRVIMSPIGSVIAVVRSHSPALLRHSGLLDLSASEVAFSGPSLPEREIESGQQGARFLVGARGRADRDVHAPDLGRLVVVDLREHDVLLDADRVVAAAVEALG